MKETISFFIYIIDGSMWTKIVSIIMKVVKFKILANVCLMLLSFYYCKGKSMHFWFLIRKNNRLGGSHSWPTGLHWSWDTATKLKEFHINSQFPCCSLCLSPFFHCLVLPAGLQYLHFLCRFRTLHSRSGYLVHLRWVSWRTREHPVSAD